MGACPWVAHTQHDLAAVLRRRDGPATASAQMTWIGPHLPRGATRDGAHRQWVRPRTARGQRVAGGAAMDATFQREGEYWTIEFERQSFQVRFEGHEIPGPPPRRTRPGGPRALDLARLDGSTSVPASDQREARSRLARADAVSSMRPRGLSPSDRRHPERAGGGRVRNDPERADRLRAEEAAIAPSSARHSDSVGAIGRRNGRGAAGSSHWAIRAALGRIGEQSDPLGRHFDATIRTGTFCTYGGPARADQLASLTGHRRGHASAGCWPRAGVAQSVERQPSS